ncbi:putative U3 small nucleolar RNA-associated protein 7 [Zancudomyces culisetae]|uniref:U three protein 7 n=1 Tax=Zancudomyces culisetae TaxID=1213189 RepID=A0A1R1PSR4_ZANCU|nr:putative U3 small nucleolar RNA-associated protein 7 [Zancudomyces culisetae]|eukprot:OMH84035.1 putative U3 small nucleolar RNA-associated protein 7 [Zancudomyces culisetae]
MGVAKEKKLREKQKEKESGVAKESTSKRIKNELLKDISAKNQKAKERRKLILGVESVEENEQSEYLKNLKTKVGKYNRVKYASLRKFKTQRERQKTFKEQDIGLLAAERAARAEILNVGEAGYLVPENEMEKTYKFKQDEIVKNVDINSVQRRFELKLDEFGPYNIDYSRNGRHLLLGGDRGHISSIDWLGGKVQCEFHVRETVRDVKYLHNETMFAVAQKKYTYLYDSRGAEIHCLKKFVETNVLDFLPYHFLLVGVGNQGMLRYQDVSTGQIVAELKTKLGPCKAMVSSKYNAVEHLGHGNGTVTLWSPSTSEPLVKMLCHKTPISSIAIDHSGTYMATSGLDNLLKVWDIRMHYKELHSYRTFTPATSMDISQLGMLAYSHNGYVTIWKDALQSKAKDPYLSHLHSGTTIESLRFVPYEDVLGFGHSTGFSSILVPGAGEPNYDTLEANPFQTSKQRKEAEVASLLDKLQPDMINLDPNFIAGMETTSAAKSAQQAREELVKEMQLKRNEQLKFKKRGRNSAAKRALRKKQKNVIDIRKLQLLDKLEKEKRAKLNNKLDVAETSGALSRFYKEKKRKS